MGAEEVGRSHRRPYLPGLVIDQQRGGHVVFTASFAGLQQRGRLTRTADIGRAAVQWPATFYAFDLLLFGDYDLRRLPLVERKRLLAKLLPSAGPIRISEHIEGAGEAMFEQLKEMNLEGIVGKRADSPYAGRRSPDWVKVSARSNDDFAVVGYTPPKGGRTGFGIYARRGPPTGGRRHPSTRARSRPAAGCRCPSRTPAGW